MEVICIGMCAEQFSTKIALWLGKAGKKTAKKVLNFFLHKN